MKRIVLMAPMVCGVLPAPDGAHAADAGPGKQYACGGNDDTVRPYDPLLRTGLLKAYRQLFPDAPMPPGENELQAGAAIRCMNGRLLACFTGANLPCAKMNRSPNNTGAEAFCRTSPDADVVPAFAAGHDAAYRYRCVSGQAKAAGRTFALDRRGFAAKLWAPLE